MTNKPTPLPRRALIKCAEADAYAKENEDQAREIARLVVMAQRYTRTNPQQVEIILDKIATAAQASRADAATVRRLMSEIKQIGGSE